MKLDGKIDKIIDMVIDGETFREIAETFGVSIGTLHNYLASDEHSARAQAALALSASQYADKAEEVLLAAERDGIEMTRARELAQHYRWKASKRDPKRYGDRMDVTTNGKDMSSLSVTITTQEAQDISKALEGEV